MRKLLKIVLVVFCLLMSFGWSISASLEASDSKMLPGMCYGPFRDNQDPDSGMFPSRQDMETDIRFASNLTGGIRTYGSGQTPGYIPGICDQIGMDCSLGAWLGKDKKANRKEIEAVIKIAHEGHKSLKTLIVGSEVLLRKDLSEDELIAYINEVRERTKDVQGIKIAYAEIGGVILAQPKVTKSVDIIMPHIYSYWDGISIEQGAQYIVDYWSKISKTFPGKEIIIGETGWPSDGKTNWKAVASEENQARFFKEFTELARTNNIKYFYFEMFDEKWKEKFEGKVGACWGLYESNGKIKPKNQKLVPKLAETGINRPPQTLSSVEITAPFVVYDDDQGDQDHFVPSGWMGDQAAIKLDRDCTVNPHSGKNCICISYTPELSKNNRWSGVYWQFPLNNWGKYPGYKMKTGAKALNFWARGENGGEKSEFKVGGIFDSKFPFHDSFGPKSTDVVTLSKEWKRYSISLKGENLSNIIGGFCWVTNTYDNPSSCRIYIDDVKIE